jgi:hypothetical protein
VVGCKRVSKDTQYTLVWDLCQGDTIDTLRWGEEMYVICQYEKKWYLAFVAEVSRDTLDANVVLFTPHGPSNVFSFPDRESVTTIPLNHILAEADVDVREEGYEILNLKEVLDIVQNYADID